MPGELAIGDLDRPALHTDERVRKINKTRDGKIIGRTDLHSPISVGHFDLLEHSKELARRFEGGCASMLDHLYEWLGASIEDWDLEGIEFYDAVVDVASSQGGEQMFDGGDHDALSHKGGSIANPCYILRRCRYLKVIEIGSPEDVARVCRRRTQCQPDWFARMQTVSPRSDSARDSLLWNQTKGSFGARKQRCGGNERAAM